jgi:hypothetical protein
MLSINGARIQLDKRPENKEPYKPSIQSSQVVNPIKPNQLRFVVNIENDKLIIENPEIIENLDIDRVCTLTPKEIDIDINPKFKANDETLLMLQTHLVNAIRLHNGIIDDISDRDAPLQTDKHGGCLNQVQDKGISIKNFYIEDKEFLKNKQYYMQYDDVYNRVRDESKSIMFTVERKEDEHIITLNAAKKTGVFKGLFISSKVQPILTKRFKNIDWNIDAKPFYPWLKYPTFNVPNMIKKYGIDWVKFSCYSYIEPDTEGKQDFIIRQKVSNDESYNEYIKKCLVNQSIDTGPRVLGEEIRPEILRNIALYPDNNPISFENELATVLQKHVNLLYPLAAITCENLPLPQDIYYFKDFLNYKSGQRIVHFRQFNRKTCGAASVLNVMYVFFNRMSNHLKNRENNKAVYSEYLKYEKHLDVNEFATNVVNDGRTIKGYSPTKTLKFLVPKSNLPGYTIKTDDIKYVFDLGVRVWNEFQMADMKPGSIYSMGWYGFINNEIVGHAYTIHFESLDEYYIYDSSCMFTFNNIEDYKQYVNKTHYNMKDISHYQLFFAIEPKGTRLLAGSGMGKKVYKPDLYLCNDNRKRKVFRIKGDKTIHPNTLFTIYKGKVVRLRDVPSPIKKK